jgi:hypothetical protein
MRYFGLGGKKMPLDGLPARPTTLLPSPPRSGAFPEIEPGACPIASGPASIRPYAGAVAFVGGVDRGHFPDVVEEVQTVEARRVDGAAINPLQSWAMALAVLGSSACALAPEGPHVCSVIVPEREACGVSLRVVI